MSKKLTTILFEKYPSFFNDAKKNGVTPVVLDNCINGEDQISILRKDRYFIFLKDNYLFFGSRMTNYFCACPTCILYSITYDEETLEAITNNLKTDDATYEKIKMVSYVPSLTNNDTVIISLDNFEVKKIKTPYRHPCCDSVFHNAFTPHFKKEIHNKLDDEKFDELLKEVYDEDAGIIRIFNNVKDLRSNKLGDLSHEIEVYFSWFVNPIFPLFPIVGFFDLGIGIGYSEKSAKIRAIYESLERYCALSPPLDEKMIHGSYNQLRDTINCLDPECFWRYDESSLRDEFNPLGNIDNDTSLNWVGIENILDNSKFYIPEDYAYINLRVPSKFNENSTSGCAAHNNKNQAMMSSLLELIERDNILRFWVLKKSCSHINVESLPSKFDKFKIFFDSQGYDLYLINCSTFKGVFTIIAHIKNRVQNRPYAMTASGSGLNLESAIEKAIRELYGVHLMTTILDSKDETHKLNEYDVIAPEDHYIYYRNPSKYKYIDFFSNPKKMTDYKSIQLLEISNDRDLLIIVNSLKELGVNVFFKELTLPEVKQYGVHVYRCFSPELLPLTFGTGHLKLLNTNEDLNYGKLVHAIPHPYG